MWLCNRTIEVITLEKTKNTQMFLFYQYQLNHRLPNFELHLLLIALLFVFLLVQFFLIPKW